MNDFCKDCLYHAWGKTPEQKQAEQEYNASYYQQNKQRWVINKQKRQAALQGPPLPAHMRKTEPTPSYSIDDSVATPILRGMDVVRKMSDKNVVIDLGPAVKKGVKKVASAVKTTIDIGKRAVEKIADVVSFEAIRDWSKRMKELRKQSYLRNY